MSAGISGYARHNAMSRPGLPVWIAACCWLNIFRDLRRSWDMFQRTGPGITRMDGRGLRRNRKSITRGKSMAYQRHSETAVNRKCHKGHVYSTGDPDSRWFTAKGQARYFCPVCLRQGDKPPKSWRRITFECAICSGEIRRTRTRWKCRRCGAWSETGNM